MDRRLFLLTALAAGAQTGLPAIGSGASSGPTFGPSGDSGFDAWREGFWRRMVGLGMEPGLLNRELAGLSSDSRVSALDNQQPELSQPVGVYIKNTVAAARVQQGHDFLSSLTFLPAMEVAYGVQSPVVLGIWAIESSFGKIQGSMDTVRCLATLAADGRRRAFAEGELEAALRIIGEGQQPRSRLTGSWAGAMGQTQFLPSVYRTTAIDGDADGKRDIWGSTQDALYSAANYLKTRGSWVAGGDWAREVTLPGDFDYGLAEGPKKTPFEWAMLGVGRAEGGVWSAVDSAAQAQLLLPAGAHGPAFLAFPNHFAIRSYNNSTAYALAVGLLADGFSGAPALVTPWPAETPLSLSDRTAAQAALAKLGFDPGGVDGVVGAGTRSALRAWQQANKLPADAYLTPDLVLKLKAAAGL
ncbi:MAG: peptidoglycan-binding protein [Caulobacteraceae bacterium]|nr:peptidoglycan-binding protein [Caulobacteraceae bacterium]